MKKIPLKREEDYYIKVLLRDVKLRDIMSAPVIAVLVDSHFRDVPKKLKKHHIRHLPIVGENDKLVGLISQRDVFRVCPPHKTEDGQWVYDDRALDGVVLRHVMVQNPFCMNQDDSMGNALVQIVNKKYGSIPIVNNDMQLKGIVTQHDILAIAAQIFLE